MERGQLMETNVHQHERIIIMFYNTVDSNWHQFVEYFKNRCF